MHVMTASWKRTYSAAVDRPRKLMKLSVERLGMGEAVRLENISEECFESVEVYLAHSEVHRGEQSWHSQDGS